jgi:phage-related minor tail protein
MAVDILSIGIELDTRQIKSGQRDLDNLGKSADNASRDTIKFEKSVQSASSSLASFARSALAPIAGITSLVAVMNKLVSETIKSQNEQSQLSAVLRSTGESAGFTADQLNKMATSMAKASTFGAGDIVSAQTRLLSYTNIMGNEFPAAMQSVIDMSARLGMSLEQSAETIGRALDIPSQGLSALSRQGFRFSEEQRELAKQLEATGRTAEAQKMILDALANAYGGAAEAAKNTLGGSLAELREAFNTLFTVSSENAGFFAQAISGITTAVKILNGEVKTSSDLFDRMFPAYQKYSEQLAKEQGQNANKFQFGGRFTNLPTPNTQLIDLTKEAEFFRKNNPLNDSIAKSELLRLRIQEINNLYEASAITLQEKNRYIAQFNNEYGQIATKVKEVSEAEKELNRIRENQKGFQQQIEDLIAVNKLMFEGVNIDEAKLRVDSIRKGIKNEQIEQLLKEQEIQKGILETIQTKKQAEQNELERIEEVRRANQRASDEYLRTIQRAEEERTRQAERTARDINRSLTDALLRGFESGLSFAENFRRTLINMFSTLVLRPAIEMILSPVSNAVGNAFGQKSGGFASLSNDIFSVFTTTNQSIISGIESVGASIANGLGGIRDSIGGFVGQNASLISNVLSYSGAILQLAQGNFAGAAGTAIGTFFGGPVGGAIGSFIGSAVGGIFGGKKQPPRTVTPLDNVSEQFNQTISALLTGFGAGGNVSSSSIFSGRAGGSGYGFFDTSINGQNFTDSIRYKGDYSEQSMNQFIQRVLVDNTKRAIEMIDLPEGIKKFFENLTDAQDIQRTVSVLITLNQQLNNLPPIFDAIRNAISTTDYTLTAQELEVTFNNINTYTQLFYTAAENFETFTKQLNTAFEKINVNLPETREGFRNLADGFNVVDEATAKQFHGLMALAPLADQYYKFLEAQAVELKKINEEYAKNTTDLAFDSLVKAIDAQKELAITAREVARESVYRLKNIFDILKTNIEELYGFAGAGMSSAQGMAFIEQAILTAQNTGYLPDSDKLQEAISAARSNTLFSTSFEMRREQLVLAGRLGILQELTGNQLSVAERQLRAAERQIEELENQLLLAQTQIDILRGIDTGVISVSSAIKSLANAIKAEQAARLASSSSGQVGGISSPTNPLENTINQIYQQAFGRNAEAEGLAYWTNDVMSGAIPESRLFEAILAGAQGQDIIAKTIQGFSNGGMHTGGLRMVGENGPELEVTGAARYFSTSQTSAMMGTGGEVVTELRYLREENKSQARAIVGLQSRMTRLLERWDGDGIPEERNVTA